MDRCGHHHGCGPHVEPAVIDQLWELIDAKFATNKQVLDLATELKQLELGIKVQTSHVANAAAAIVLKDVREDLAKLKNFRVEIVPFKDSEGRPVVPCGPDYKTLYLTPADNPDDKDSSLWDEWIAIPAQHAVGTKTPGLCYKWERVGNKKLDLSWVKSDFAKVNEKIAELQKKLNNTAKVLADAILDRAVKPLKDLKCYIHSPEYVAYVFQKLPRAAMGTDGLMTANQFTILSMLAVWAANDHKMMGGGALGSDMVIHLLDKVGIPTDDLKDKFHHGCGVCEDWEDRI